MTPAAATSMLDRMLARVGENIAIRRYTGTGQGRTFTDTPARARVTGYAPRDLVGAVIQGDRKLIVSSTGLSALVALTTNDKAVVRGRELAIVSIDDSSRRLNGVLIGYDIQVRG